MVAGTGDCDPERLRAWLAEAVDPCIFSVRHFRWAGADLDYDDQQRTIRSGRLELAGAGDDRLTVELTPVAPSVAFDMAHTCEEPEYWLYWRTLVQARVSGWDAPARGWFEASRYGCT